MFRLRGRSRTLNAAEDGRRRRGPFVLTDWFGNRPGSCPPFLLKPEQKTDLQPAAPHVSGRSPRFTPMIFSLHSVLIQRDCSRIAGFAPRRRHPIFSSNNSTRELETEDQIASNLAFDQIAAILHLARISTVSTRRAPACVVGDVHGRTRTAAAFAKNAFLREDRLLRGMPERGAVGRLDSGDDFELPPVWHVVGSKA